MITHEIVKSHHIIHFTIVNVVTYPLKKKCATPFHHIIINKSTNKSILEPLHHCTPSPFENDTKIIVQF